MGGTSSMIYQFTKEFSSIKDKFEIIKLIDGKRSLSYKEIEFLKLPSSDNNLVWHPGVYIFFASGKPLRVGRHLANSRYRVLENLKQNTRNELASVWDVKDAPDGEIVLFNVIDRDDYHWVAAVEIFMEKTLKNELAIPAKRQG
ncbi:MAG: hypothetical protein AAGG59_09980 [Bacteroidota bacterium]